MYVNICIGSTVELSLQEKKGQFASWMRVITQTFKCLFTILQALITVLHGVGHEHKANVKETCDYK